MTFNLVCLPGFMCDAALFEPMADQLRAITVDPLVRLCHGDVYRDPSIDGMAERVLDEAPPRFALLGFSMGGFVARQIALRAPERVSRLILIATSARATSPAEHARKRALLANLADHGFTGMSRRALAGAIHEDHPERDRLIEDLHAMGARLGGSVMANQLQATRLDGHRDLATIAAKSLVVAARDDKLRPLDEVRALADGLRNARFVVLERCGHMVPLEQPDALARLVVDFLSE